VNAYNPERKKFFDAGLNGEKAFSIQQLILLGGKRRSEVEMAKANKQIAELELADLFRNLRLQLRQNYFGIYYDNLSFQAVSKQMANLDTLIVSYKKQVEKGNISPKDLVRLQALYLNFKQQKSDLYNSIIQSKSDLELMVGIKGIEPQPAIDELTVYWKKEMPNADSLATKALDKRSDYLMAVKQIDAQNWNLKLQKAQNVPDLNVGVGWDQQGAAFLNAVTFSVGIPLPILNQNQGNIKQAEAQLKAASTSKMYQAEKVKHEVELALKQWKDASENYELLKPEAVRSFKEVEDGVMTNFRHGNMSLIEFTDFTESYDQTLMQYYKFAKTLINSCEQINYTTNSSIF
jgi:cobalt-zinc-cadmium efflux system outer membrane protein